MDISRKLTTELVAWKTDSHRKPLLVRGARQVGKSTLIKEFGRTFANFVEINFERVPQIKQVFTGDLSPLKLLPALESVSGSRIVPGQTLLFFDEIQECPQAVVALRYWYEMLPNLHVIAAGSLLDFTLEEIGLPVGRVQTLFLYPLSFYEFLSAVGGGRLLEHAQDQEEGVPSSFDPTLHSELIERLKIYMAIGGMPEAVTRYLERQSVADSQLVHLELLTTFRQDFHKYARRSQVEHVETVFSAMPRMFARKFRYSEVDSQLRSSTVRTALDLLHKAGLAYKIFHSSGHGLPLGAGIDPRKFKVFALDIGLAQTTLGLDLAKWTVESAKEVVNNGPMAEQFVAQELIASSQPRSSAELYYWQREAPGSSAEIDFLLSEGQTMAGVEVKSGSFRRSKSLHLFYEQTFKRSKLFELSAYPSQRTGSVSSWPLYLAANIRRNINIGN